MGVLMESSQINIHARAEQNLKPGALFPSSDKRKDRSPGEESTAREQLRLSAQSVDGLSYSNVIQNAPRREPHLLNADNTASSKEYFLPTPCWNSSVKYGHREINANGKTTSPDSPPESARPESLKRSDTSEVQTHTPEFKSMPPPKKKWMKNYMEEEPPHISIVLPRNGLRVGPPPASAPIAVPPPSTLGGHMPSGISTLPTLFTDSSSELPRARSNSNGSSGPRAGTREVHNKLEKNRRAHLKECFEALRLQLPSSADDKKSSNLSILDSAIKYIQLLKRREKDLEHEMERLAREKIAHQQKLSTLRRDIPTPTRIRHPTNHDRETAMEVDEIIPSRVSPLFLSTSSPSAPMQVSHSGLEVLVTTQSPALTRLSPSTVQTNVSTSLDLTTKSSRLPQSLPHAQIISLHSSNGSTVYSHMGHNASSIPTSLAQRTQSAQIISSFSQNISNGILTNPKSLNLINPNIQRGQKISSISSNMPTLTVTTVNPGSVMTVNQGQIKHGQIHNQSQTVEGKVISSVMSSNGQTAIVHPAQLQLPVSQVMSGSGLVVNPTIQLFSASPQSLRVLQAPSGALASLELPSNGANNSVQRIRDPCKLLESSVSVNISGLNGVLRTSGDRSTHHIAIKPQPVGNMNASIRSTGTQGSITQMMNGLTPLVVSQGGHLMTASSHITGKVCMVHTIGNGQSSNKSWGTSHREYSVP
ncbi:uncharacterized protein LOC143920209 isoform X2 [Arctopsyche grandis]|uniref:uncharacterized protein LOC143920209 isoform X2 n=1 Tax=Arctopsyche grandis TaxID=121162 RepID=UPI00406D8816